MWKKQPFLVKVKNALVREHIEYEDNYLTFRQNGKLYQVFRTNQETQTYRLNVYWKKKCVSEEYKFSEFVKLWRTIQDFMRGERDSDFND